MENTVGDPDAVRSAPLAGVRVLDLSQVMAAPLAAQCLGDFGADVVKVEPVGVGDVLRPLDRVIPKEGVSVYFGAANRNKRSVAIDLRTEAGRAIVRRLVTGADIVVHNYRPGVMERLGLGFADMSAWNPGVISISVTGFGTSGPLAGKAGQDFLAQSMSGLLNRNSRGVPALVSTPITDWGAGMLMVQGALLALLERARSGRGQEIEVNLLDSAVFYQVLEYTALLTRGEVTNFQTSTLTDVFQTRDGWITLVGHFRENPLRDICRALECTDHSQRPEFSTFDLQLDHRDEVLDVLRPEFMRYTSDDVVRRLDSVDILSAAILDAQDLIAHPQFEANGSLVEMALEDGSVVRGIANPVKLSATPATVARAPERLGASTADVLSELGYSQDEIDRLVADGVVESPRADGRVMGR